MTHVQKVWTAADEYKKDSDLNPADIKELKQWCQHTPKIPQCVTDEQLILFLHSCYYNIENAKKCIAEYYRLRRKAPQFFNDRDVTRPELQKALQVLHYSIFVPRNPDGYKIVFHRLKDNNPDNYVFSDGFKLLAMAMDTLFVKEGPLSGVILLFDMAGVKVSHVTRLSIMNVKRCIEYIQDGNPIRLKSVHVLNVHPVIDKIMLLIRPFVRKQFLDLLNFHKEGDESVYETIPKSCLPSDYDGELDSVEQLHEQFIKEMEEMHPLFMKEDKILSSAFLALKDKNFEKDISLAKLDID